MAGAGSVATFGRFVEEAHRITLLTGAGLSTECGVPDFRSPSSPWRIHPPIAFQDFLGDPGSRAEAWRRKFAMDDLYAGARPGRGHEALTRLQRAGRIVAVITQNIDGLQQDSGFPTEKLIELHGNGTYARCLSCRHPHALAPIRAAFEKSGAAPPCSICGGLLKSGSVSFGQALDADLLRRSAEASLGCDLFIVLGSSLMVRPAARFPDLASRNGAKLAIVNREPTPADASADLVIHDDIGSVLSTV